ncbi:hypothetical protein [Algoriphagus sediminis]|uniref:Uncharacterized protein n=1 Tax=Algoriphagus sediminis TaxID=3057113 RepID=A0ABT7YFH3_9BACT|nr:hypothetical protein [Algoriphagus sediminis]MDN3205278.1 hypothetical protein [Algoriphagus sediminis]
MKEDQEIQQFFDELRVKDQSIDIPEFQGLPKPKANMTPLWLTVGIAASLFLFAPLIWPEEERIEAPAEVLIISLEETPDNEQQFIIEQTTYLDTWESPTASLLTEY